MHTFVKNVEGAFPQALVPKFFAVADNATVDLVDLLKAPVNHEGGQDLAANSAGAVGHHRLVLHPVIFAGFQLSDEVVSGIHIGHDGVFEFADLRLIRIAAVEKDNVITLLYELVDLLRLQMAATADDPRIVDTQFFWHPEGDNLIAHFHAEFRKVRFTALGPLELDAAEVLLGFAHISLAGIHIPADGAIDAVGGDDNATEKPQAFTEIPLPQTDRLRVGYGAELVVEQDLFLHASSLRSSCCARKLALAAVVQRLSPILRFSGGQHTE